MAVASLLQAHFTIVLLCALCLKRSPLSAPSRRPVHNSSATRLAWTWPRICQRMRYVCMYVCKYSKRFRGWCCRWGAYSSSTLVPCSLCAFAWDGCFYFYFISPVCPRRARKGSTRIGLLEEDAGQRVCLFSLFRLKPWSGYTQQVSPALQSLFFPCVAGDTLSRGLADGNPGRAAIVVLIYYVDNHRGVLRPLSHRRAV